MRDNGVHRAAVFTTSAWGGYSSCTQYIEDIARARLAVGERAPELVKLRHYFDHPLLVAMFTDAIAAAAQSLPDDLRDDVRVVFTAHSIPVAADERHGPNLYSRQVDYATRLVAGAAGHDDYDQVWQSRSGPPQIPWLEPDIADHLTRLADAGTKAVIVCPIGFVADHIEVVWDLDYELRIQAERAGIAFARARTPAPTVVSRDGRRPDRRAALRPRTSPRRGPKSGARVRVQRQRPAMRAAMLRRYLVSHAEYRISPSAAIRAERTTCASGRSASFAICTSDDVSTRSASTRS